MLKIQHQKLFGCAESFGWESHLVSGLLVCSYWGHIIRDIQIHIGSVYLGKDIKTEQDVALKLEVTQDLSSNLVHKYNVYQALSGLSGIPKVYWYGREGPYHVIVLDRLGSTLKEIGWTSIGTNAVFTYAVQMVFLFLTYIYLLMFMYIQAFDIWVIARSTLHSSRRQTWQFRIRYWQVVQPGFSYQLQTHSALP